ncbi:MAG: hypothetical protein HPY83_14345 [Anaerolineae bacterium]|nr:hypothetical protein [Anaerolineae bacterium]
MEHPSKDRTTPAGSEIDALTRLFRLVGYLPAAWLLLFLSFVAWTSAQQGRLVAYGDPDPKRAGAAGVLYYPVILMLIGVIASVPVWSILALSSRFRLTVRKRDLVIYLGSLALLLVLFRCDVAGLGTWLAD